LNNDELLPLSECKHQEEIKSNEKIQNQEETERVEIYNRASVSTPDTFWQQVPTLLKITALHPDRLFFLVVFVIPLNCGIIWYANFLSTTDSFWMIALTPTIFIISSSIVLSNAIFILAQERDLGVLKLLFSQGISRKAYLVHYLLYYGLFSLPVPISCLIYIGSLFGSAGSAIALAGMFFSYFIFHMGFSVFLGSILDTRTAFVSVNILPTIMGIFAQGSTSSMFANSYPGCTGQVMSALIVNDISKFEWGLYALAFILNMLLGAAGLYVFMSKFENHNMTPKKLCSREKTIHHEQKDEADEENTRAEKICLRVEILTKFTVPV
jgi:hypothetical protein